jgi:hypothetical protein
MSREDRITSSDEMYELGIRDAELDDLNELYYQHYYYYRKGYDKRRGEIRRAATLGTVSNRPLISVVLVLLVVAVLAGAGYLFLKSGISITASGDRVGGTPVTPPTPTPTVVYTPTATIAPPTPTPQPFLHPGARAQVINVGSAPLLGRSQPGTNYPVQTSFPEGTIVTILEGPVEADGYIWWRIEAEGAGQGWSADRGPDGSVWLQPI